MTCFCTTKQSSNYIATYVCLANNYEVAICQYFVAATLSLFYATYINTLVSFKVALLSSQLTKELLVELN